MSKSVVEIYNLGKKYPNNATAIVDYRVEDIFRKILGLSQKNSSKEDVYWALKNATFKLNDGDVLGVIGVNGSGKTTLVKLIAEMIEPDEGHVKVAGNIQSMINLNAGFNFRLNGIENIKNSLSLRGISGRQAKSRLEQIIEFSELEEFISNPVSTYSSGMAMRLGFSTCIHLDPALLLIDEVLAVGDYAFQNKCLLKMHQLKQTGVTMIFVSHSMGAIRLFCNSALWLNHGNVIAMGETKEITENYIAWIDKIELEKQRKHLEKISNPDNTKPESTKKKNILFGGIHHLKDFIDDISVNINDSQDNIATVNVHDKMRIVYSFKLLREVDELTINVRIHRADGLLLARLSSLDDGASDHLRNLSSGQIEGELTINDLNITPGDYKILLAVVMGRTILFRDVVANFRVMQDVSYFNGLVSFKRSHEIRHLKIP